MKNFVINNKQNKKQKQFYETSKKWKGNKTKNYEITTIQKYLNFLVKKKKNFIEYMKCANHWLKFAERKIQKWKIHIDEPLNEEKQNLFHIIWHNLSLFSLYTALECNNFP